MIDLAKIFHSIAPTLTALSFDSDNAYHVAPIGNRLTAAALSRLTHFSWNTKSLSKEIVKFIRLLGPAVQSMSIKESGWPAQPISDHELDAVLPSLQSLTLSGDAGPLSSSLFLFKDATLSHFTLSSTTGLCYLLSSGFLLSFLRKQAPTLKTIHFDSSDHYSIHADMEPIYGLAERHNIKLKMVDAEYFTHWPTTAKSRPHDDPTIFPTPAEKKMKCKIMHAQLQEVFKARRLEMERLVETKDLAGLEKFAGLFGKGANDRMLAQKD